MKDTFFARYTIEHEGEINWQSLRNIWKKQEEGPTNLPGLVCQRMQILLAWFAGEGCCMTLVNTTVHSRTGSNNLSRVSILKLPLHLMERPWLRI